jgi:EmrB/QacA subfamily drug resistance transporter
MLPAAAPAARLPAIHMSSLPSAGSAAPVVAPQAEPEISAGRRRLIGGCILLSVFLAAMEATIAATAMPTIVADLGGFNLYSWIFSGYLVVQAATTVAAGKLADLYGRRPVMIVGIAIFMAASVFAGFAWSMPVLIVARLLQGFGSGGIQPISAAMVADLFSPSERPRMQGYVSSMWGIASVVAPLIGGVIVSHFSWSWIFWLNVVLGLPPLLGFLFLYPEKTVHHGHDIDYLGAALFTISIGALVVVLVQGGTTWPWTSTPVFVLGGVFVAALALFLVQERRATEPMVALDLWRDRRLTMNNATIAVLGMTLVGMSFLMPLYVQGILRGSAVEGGLPLAALGVGWPVASTSLSWLVRLFGRFIIGVGAGIFTLGAASLVFLGASSGGGLVATIAAGFVMGFGMGAVNTTCVILIQGTFSRERRASALASNVFARIIGTAIGAAVLGGILNAGLQATLSKAHSGLTIDSVRKLLESNAAVDAAQQHLLREALYSGLHSAFIAIVVLGALAFALALFIRVVPTAFGLDETAKT